MANEDESSGEVGLEARFGDLVVGTVGFLAEGFRSLVDDENFVLNERLRSDRES